MTLPTTSSGGSCLVPLTHVGRVSSLLDMTLNDDHAAALRQAAERVAAAKAEFDAAKSDRETLIAQIALTGGTYREIAAESGLSYQRVHQLLTGEKAPMRPWGTDELFHCPRCEATPGEHCKDEKGRRRHATHIDRSHHCQRVFEGLEEPALDEPGPHTALYEAHEHIFPGLGPNAGYRTEGPIYIDPNAAAAKAATLRNGYVGRWTGQDWERIDG